MADEPDGSKCSSCKSVFDDVKSIVQCTICKTFFHGKCENIDLRGFYMSLNRSESD